MPMCYHLYALAVNGLELVSRGGAGCIAWSKRPNLAGILSRVDIQTRTECNVSHSNKIHNGSGVNFTMRCVGRGPLWCTEWPMHP